MEQLRSAIEERVAKGQLRRATGAKGGGNDSCDALKGRGIFLMNVVLLYIGKRQLRAITRTVTSKEYSFSFSAQ